ncbi:MAG: ankyrin repeat domain-containing protein [Simkaniaceae bacterium]|nr:ankyrin repeat domain-containing protein [Simkaniaceae bacterium]
MSGSSVPSRLARADHVDEGVPCRESNGDLAEKEHRANVVALRTLRYMGTGCVVGAVAGVGLTVVPLSLVPAMVVNGFGFALFGAFAGFTVRVMRQVLYEGPALIRASATGNIDKVRELCKGDVWVDALDNEGQTALTHVARTQHTQIAEELLKWGADINHVDDRGRTPLMFAVRNDRTDMVQTLLKHGADVNLADDDDGYTPLILATLFGNPKIMRMLLAQKNIDLLHTEHSGLTALDLAIEATGRRKIENMLREALGEPPDTFPETTGEHATENVLHVPT